MVLGIVSGFLLLGDAFFWSWARSSEGHSDIAARAPFLLVIYLPYFAITVAATAAIIACLRARREQLNVRMHLVSALIATLGVGIALYFDPSVSFWRAVNLVRTPLQESWGHPAILLSDVALAVLAWWLGRARTPRVLATPA